MMSNYKYCIRDNGEILKIDKRGDIKIIEGEIDKIIKNKLEFIITTTSLIEYQIENHELVEYRCTAKLSPNIFARIQVKDSY